MTEGSTSPRRFPRVSVDLTDESSAQRLLDLSLGGMRVQSIVAIHLDQASAFPLPMAEGAVRLKGRVVWARCTGDEEFPYEYGVEFESMGPGVLEQLQAFMMSRGLAKEPPVEVDAAEIERLGRRIIQLERELIATRRKGSGSLKHLAFDPDGLPAAGADEPQDESAKEAQPTRFEAKRFARLVMLGQPLMPLVADPAARVQNESFRCVAAAFSDSFDVATLEARLDGTLNQGIVMRALHSFYELGCIDFA